MRFIADSTSDELRSPQCGEEVEGHPYMAEYVPSKEDKRQEVPAESQPHTPDALDTAVFSASPGPALSDVRSEGGLPILLCRCF